MAQYFNRNSNANSQRIVYTMSYIKNIGLELSRRKLNENLNDWLSKFKTIPKNILREPLSSVLKPEGCDSVDDTKHVGFISSPGNSKIINELEEDDDAFGEVSTDTFVIPSSAYVNSQHQEVTIRNSKTDVLNENLTTIKQNNRGGATNFTRNTFYRSGTSGKKKKYSNWRNRNNVTDDVCDDKVRSWDWGLRAERNAMAFIPNHWRPNPNSNIRNFMHENGSSWRVSNGFDTEEPKPEVSLCTRYFRNVKRAYGVQPDV